MIREESMILKCSMKWMGLSMFSEADENIRIQKAGFLISFLDEGRGEQRDCMNHGSWFYRAVEELECFNLME